METFTTLPCLWVLVSNDKNNCTTGFVLGLELRESPSPFPQTALGPADHTLGRTLFLGANLRLFRLDHEVQGAAGSLGQREGAMSPGGIAKMDAHLKLALGLP